VLSRARISLLAALIAIGAQTALAQMPPQRARAGGAGVPPSGPSFWFRQYCASCHGPGGTGNGPVAPSLKTRPTDLTLLSRNNGGAFPEREVHDFIDGTKAVPAHGSREMPVWGYPTAVKGIPRGFFKPELTQEDIDARITALVDYVKSIQK
jgi:mono/diheme cytochrome c family protein